MAFSDIFQRTLRAVVDRIIPADDFPGAWEAGFPVFLERLLESEPQLLPIYEAGLPALEDESSKHYNSDFADLDVSSQDALLARLVRGDVLTSWPVPPPLFFETLVRHVSESFYADPGNGGNRDCVSWRMAGYLPREEGEIEP
jgi:hypothetical protein